ncbi:glycosyltransferase family 4 protein [Sulfuriroseicoccus oceanibius]|uniref:Glycosyltransferase family 4 protein n=1 Tax=Sulfuriroseicoccus oceanibius TaxID=2707525 RepID=A0A6B3L5Y7_9BACT|nr:glycosyltransferase family 4 protein [Sulfuriroseicoccus oceanibius]QQL45713.1 glycosyltransferase family 4 protein [Sulfuriroseicoccus oceanibius]
MRIGLARRGYSASGGAERFLLRFAEGLRAAGHEPVFCVDRAWRKAGLKSDEVVWLDGMTPLTFANTMRQTLATDVCDCLFSLERGWACDVYRAGDGVHKAWLDRRSAFEPSYKSWFRAIQSKHRAMMRLEASLLGDTSHCPAVVVNSKMVAKEIAEHYPDRDPDSVHLVYNGYDPVVEPETLDRAAMRAEVRRELGISDQEKVVLFVGSGWERKGLPDLIKASSGQNCRLVVAGRGRMRSEWKGRKQVTFLGPRKDVARLLMMADVFALPTYYDPFSNATLEAARHGLPVITTTANGFHEVMTEGVHGSAVDAGDVSALAAAIDHWATLENDDTVFSRCLENVKPFTIDRNVSETLKVVANADRVGLGVATAGNPTPVGSPQTIWRS